jgi:hypothetical protein
MSIEISFPGYSAAAPQPRWFALAIPPCAQHPEQAGYSQVGRDGAIGKTIGTAQDNVSAASEPVARLGTVAPTQELGALFLGDQE